MKLIKETTMKRSMKIPINIPDINDEEIREVRNVLLEKSLTSSSFDGGTRVQQFEKLLSKFVKSKFAVAVNSGTAALQASLYVLDIKPGDEVLIPSFTFIATANSIKSVGAKPVFVDINYNLKIIEDASQSLGSKLKGKHSGTFSHLGCFSLYAAKVMTSGEGGAIVTDNKKLSEKLKQIRNHGISKNHLTTAFGLNLRLPEINAAIAKVQMKKLPALLKKRKSNAQILTELLKNYDIILPKQRKSETLNWYLYTIALKNRNVAMKKLNSSGINSSVYYSPPIHKTPYYKTKTSLRNTEWAACHVLSLPIHPKVRKSDMIKMKKILSRNRN